MRPPPAGARLLRKREYALGVVFIVLVSLIWAVASIITQQVETEGVDPYVLTYVCNAMFVVLLLPRPMTRKDDGATALADGTEPSYVTVNADEAANDDDDDDDDDDDGAQRSATTLDRCGAYLRGRPLRAALVLSPMWVGGQALYNLSLKTTSVTSSTILSSTSSAFTLVFGVLAGVERLQPEKVLGAVLCIVGSSLVALSDDSSSGVSQETEQSVFGDVAALLSAASYGVYTATLRLAEPRDLARLLGLMGAANFVIFAAPLAFYCGATRKCGGGWSLRAVGLVLIQGLFDNVISDFLWARAVMLTSPTAATIGLSLTIPIAFGTDAILHGVAPRHLSTLGAVCVVTGFVSVVWRDDSNPDVRPKRRPPTAAAAAAAARVQGADLRVINVPTHVVVDAEADRPP